MENVWHNLRAIQFAITVFDSCDEIVEKCCEAWPFFADDVETVTSVS